MVQDRGRQKVKYGERSGNCDQKFMRFGGRGWGGKKKKGGGSWVSWTGHGWNSWGESPGLC